MIRLAAISAAASVAFFVLVVMTAGTLHVRLGADPSLTVLAVASELIVAMAVIMKWVRG